MLAQCRAIQGDSQMQCAMLGRRHGDHVFRDGIGSEAVLRHALDETQSSHDVESVRCRRISMTILLMLWHIW